MQRGELLDPRVQPGVSAGLGVARRVQIEVEAAALDVLGRTAAGGPAPHHLELAGERLQRWLVRAVAEQPADVALDLGQDSEEISA